MTISHSGKGFFFSANRKSLRNQRIHIHISISCINDGCIWDYSWPSSICVKIARRFDYIVAKIGGSIVLIEFTITCWFFFPGFSYVFCAQFLVTLAWRWRKKNVGIIYLDVASSATLDTKLFRLIWVERKCYAMWHSHQYFHSHSIVLQNIFAINEKKMIILIITYGLTALMLNLWQQQLTAAYGSQRMSRQSPSTQLTHSNKLLRPIKWCKRNVPEPEYLNWSLIGKQFNWADADLAYGTISLNIQNIFHISVCNIRIPEVSNKPSILARELLCVWGARNVWSSKGKPVAPTLKYHTSKCKFVRFILFRFQLNTGKHWNLHVVLKSLLSLHSVLQILYGKIPKWVNGTKISIATIGYHVNGTCHWVSIIPVFLC